MQINFSFISQFAFSIDCWDLYFEKANCSPAPSSPFGPDNLRLKNLFADLGNCVIRKRICSFNFELSLPSVFIGCYVAGFSYFDFADFVVCFFFYFT